ncbi:MAG: hypothetical protein EA361_02930 [Bacteroidetes bacterium]|nr:MAG: hypothetical protein EA361_02930 [Bacteroidota bacterium]
MPRTIISKLQENPDYLKNAAAKSNAGKRKTRYKQITFKITDTQKEALEVICKRQKTTPVRYLKSVIRKQTARYKSSPQPVSYVTENQLQLF